MKNNHKLHSIVDSKDEGLFYTQSFSQYFGIHWIKERETSGFAS